MGEVVGEVEDTMKAEDITEAEDIMVEIMEMGYGMSMEVVEMVEVVEVEMVEVEMVEEVVEEIKEVLEVGEVVGKEMVEEEVVIKEGLEYGFDLSGKGSILPLKQTNKQTRRVWRLMMLSFYIGTIQVLRQQSGGWVGSENGNF